MNATTQNQKPIWLSEQEAAMDFDDLVEHIRSELASCRGKIRDVSELFPGWHERVDSAVGGLTCVISALYPGMVEYREFKERRKAKLREAETQPASSVQQ